jgi:hypothetical protein
MDATRLRLRVNKRNAAAIRSYLRSGFVFQEDVVTDIGSGFVMDDYVMEKGIESHSPCHTRGDSAFSRCFHAAPS